MECADVAVCNVNEQTCECPKGYEGDGYRCFDKDECSLKTHHCDVNSDCKNAIGSYHCECPNGYMADQSGSNCVDIDECELKMHDCHAPEDWAATPLDTRMQLGLYSSFCINTVGSFSCECDEPGFVGNGTFCQQVSPAVQAAYQQSGPYRIASEFTVDLDSCAAVHGSLNSSFILSGKPPFEINVETVRTPYEVTSLQTLVMEKPFQVRVRIDGITSEPMFADEQVYNLRVSDYQYATVFADGDQPVQSETKTIINLRIGNRICSRIAENVPTYVQLSPTHLHYGASLIISNFDRKHPMLGEMVKVLLQIAEPFLRSDFRFVSLDVAAVRSIPANGNMPNSTAIDFIFAFDPDDSTISMKSIVNVIQECLDYFENYLVEMYKVRRGDLNQSLKWSHARGRDGMIFILACCVVGLVAIALSSFTSFCAHSDNFMALGRNGRLGAHLPSVVSFILPTCVTLLEAISITWVWYDYHRSGFPILTFSKPIAAFLIAEGIVSVLALVAMCVTNVYRARYPTELVDLHLSLESLAYTFLLLLVQLPTNFVVYAYVARFKAASQPLPVSFIIKVRHLFYSFFVSNAEQTPKMACRLIIRQ